MEVQKPLDEIATLLQKIDETNSLKERALHDKLKLESEHIDFLRKAVDGLNYVAGSSMHFTGEFKESTEGLIILFDFKFAKASVRVRELLTTIENSSEKVPDYKNIILESVIKELQQQVSEL